MTRGNVIYLSERCDARVRAIGDGKPACPVSKFPGTDYHVISSDIATAARLLRAGLVPTETVASWLERLSTSANLAYRSVREFEDRALRAERQLKTRTVKTKPY